MKKTTIRIVFATVALAYVATHFLGHAHAQSSLGIGTAEQVIAPTGPFAQVVQWINVRQQEFYRALTGSLKAMREDGSQLWILIGLSFAYGIFHAAGPGHGKAVISSYMLANEVALRRGVLLSFVSAMLQAVTALVVMAAVFLALRGTAVSMTDATWALEVLSFAVLTAFGAWLLWRKLAPALRRGGQPAMNDLALAHAHHGHSYRHDHHHGNAHDHAHAPLHRHADGHDHGHHHAAGDVCETCGHAHAPDPALLSERNFSWRSAWTAIAAVGIRPCSGALIVLSFAFLNGLWLGGIVSVFAMALGTAITVSVLATLAVTAKSLAVRLAGGGAAGSRIHDAIEVTGALVLFLLGLTLLAASLAQ